MPQPEMPALWSRARFPSPGMREEFVARVRVWNLVEDLPRIDAEPLRDGVGIKFRCRDHRAAVLERLIDSLGGRVTFRLDVGLRPGQAGYAPSRPSTYG